MTSSSFYTDGETYDTAVVTSNDVPASTTPSQAPSSFFSNGGVVGEGTVVSNETGPGPRSNTPSSFFTDGPVVASETVESNDTVPSTTPSQAPSGFYPGGNIYDYLSQESAVVALLQQLAATTTTNANAASSSATQAGTYASQAATSAANAATAVQGAAGTATPLVDGTAAVGASTNWAHEDHVHPTDASRASVTYVDTQDATQLASGKSYTDTQVAPKADKAYVDTQDATKANTTYVDTQDTSGLNSAKAYTDTAVAPKADKTYVDTQDTRVVGWKLVYTNATTLTLKPYNGNAIKINGQIYLLPAAGVTIASTGMAASAVAYIYASVSSGNVVLSFGTGGHATSATSGNVGVEIYPGNDTLSLVGMVNTNASSQFVDTVASRWVRSWMNDNGSESYGQSNARVSTPSTTMIELEVVCRSSVLMWAGEKYDFFTACDLWSTTAGATLYCCCWVAGSTWVGLAPRVQTIGTGGNWWFLSAFYSAAATSDAVVTLGIGGASSGGTVNYDNKMTKISTRR